MINMSIQLQQTIYILLGTILVGVMASLIRGYTVRSFARVSGGLARFIDTKLTFIGVIHHEVSHALLAFLSGAKVRKVKLFSFSTASGNLGEVIYSPRGPWLLKRLQDSLAGLAPIICGSVTLAIIYNYLILGNTFRDSHLWVGVLLVMQISYHMSLSKSDIKASIVGIPVLFVVIYILTNVLTIDTITIVNYYKLVIGVLGINFIIALLVRLISKR